jgi:hypothetical protein
VTITERGARIIIDDGRDRRRAPGAVSVRIVAIAGAPCALDHPSSAGVQVTPFVGVTSAGASLNGRF